ncbi:hydroxypyruvate isomerase family protein [Streptomyces xanthochromogenes]|uniref:hydroxypyruvate isomerase family protein n=1 Tax=Streptomyces xanthochromogenes TaxID=67384 RepID=UPI00343EF665
MTPATTTWRWAANLKWLFTELDFEARFDAAAAAGFAGVEFPSPYGWAVGLLRGRLRDAGLTQVLINTPTGEPGTPTRSGLACIPGLEGEFRTGVERGLEYATELGCGLLHVVGGIVPDGVSRDRAFARYVTNIGWAAERARGTGIRIVLEAQNKRDCPGFVLESQEQAAAVAEAVGDEHVGLLLDFYHLQIDEGDLIGTYRRVQDRVRHLQLADVPGRHEPGTGEIGWRAVLRAVADSGYQGWIGCEYAPAGGTAAGLDWMRHIGEAAA